MDWISLLGEGVKNISFAAIALWLIRHQVNKTDKEIDALSKAMTTIKNKTEQYHDSLTLQLTKINERVRETLNEFDKAKRLNLEDYHEIKMDLNKMYGDIEKKMNEIKQKVENSQIEYWGKVVKIEKDQKALVQAFGKVHQILDKHDKKLKGAK